MISGKLIVIALFGILLFGLAVTVLSNNMALASVVFLLLIIGGVAVLAVYLYMLYQRSKIKYLKPYTKLKQQFIDAIKQCNPSTLGYLILRGDRGFSRVILGRMVGVMEWNLDTSAVGDTPNRKHRKKDKDLSELVGG
ncbi:hypothetical protein DRQ25_11555, partial [Candidatus Fermentibacteria bacterium]